MADIDLPVFSFKPNWSDGVTERLEWLTDVLRSMLGYEQRRSLRLTPRRYFEADFNPIDNERSFFALWMQRFGEQEFLMPLWHDKAKLTSTALATSSRIDFDNTYREFQAGGLAILRLDAFTYEVVEIAAMDVGGLDLVNPLVDGWDEGAVVYPLRPAMLDNPEERIAAIINRVGEAGLTFRCTRSNTYDDGAETLTLYDGYPVVSIEPNRSDALTTQFERLMQDFDASTGPIYRRDEAGRALATQFYNWQAKGRQQHHELRQTLYRLNGRQKALWMPTFNQDVVLARALAIGAADLDIQEIGFGYLGEPVSGREHIMLRDSNGVQEIVKITDTDAALGPGEERLSLSVVTAFGAPAGRIGSFIELMRLDQDAIEITHHTDTDGVCEAEAAFKAFVPDRTTAGTLVLPYPVANKIPENCGGGPGAGEDSGCLTVAEVYAGWDYEIRLEVTFTQNVVNASHFFEGPGGYIRDANPAANAYDLATTTVGLVRTYTRRAADVDDFWGNVGTGVGTWKAVYDPNVVDPFPGTGNKRTVRVYFRHWTQASGTLVATNGPNSNSGQLTLSWPVTIAWDDYR